MEKISVIIPAYNAQAYLARCLIALSEAGFSADETIVVDDNSHDDTARIASEHGVQVVRNARNMGAAGSRNAGAAKSDADILFFVDTDVLVHPDSKSVMEQFFRDHPEYAAAFGTYDDDPDCPQPVSRARNLLHRYVHLENAGEIASFWTGCGAVRRTAFEAVGGFDDSLKMMEDVDLGLRLADANLRTMLLAELQGQHLKRWTLWGTFRTDLFDRAVPWARLLRDSPPGASDRLNINSRSRFSVLAVAFACCCLLVAVAYPVAAFLGLVAAILTILALNAGFLRMIARLDGLPAVAPALLVLVVHYFCGGLGFALVRLRLDSLVK